MSDLGYQWLAQTFRLVPTQPFTVRSEIGRELDAIIRSVRENGRISSKLGKRYPLLVNDPVLGERLLRAVAEAFGDSP